MTEGSGSVEAALAEAALGNVDRLAEAAFGDSDARRRFLERVRRGLEDRIRRCSKGR